MLIWVIASGVFEATALQKEVSIQKTPAKPDCCRAPVCLVIV